MLISTRYQHQKSNVYHITTVLTSRHSISAGSESRVFSRNWNLHLKFSISICYVNYTITTNTPGVDVSSSARLDPVLNVPEYKGEIQTYHRVGRL